MSYSFKKESRLFFWILSILLSSLIFSILYYFQVFGISKNNSLPFIFSLIILIVLFIVGFFNYKLTTKLYSFISFPRDLSKLISRINLDDSEENIQKMISRFKEVFYNLDLSDKDGSIFIIRKTVGLDSDAAFKVYKILKNISFTKNVLTISGFLISVIVYFIITKVSLFNIIGETKFFPISISLLLFFIFLFESRLSSKIPSSFYINLVIINKKALINSKKDLTESENEINSTFSKRDEIREKIKDVVFNLTKQGFKKKDIVEIIDSRKKDSYGLKDLIMQSNEDFNSQANKASFKDVSLEIENILKFYEDVKNKEKEVLSLKEKINQIREIQETVEKINSNDWDYYKNIKLNLNKSKEFERNITDEISSKLHHRSELKEDKAEIIRNLYNLFINYKDSITKDQVYSFLISKGYCYETIMDLFDEFKKNNIDLTKNKKTFQDKIISKINNVYDSFKD